MIDIGGGASFLVDRLVERGFTDLTVLDTLAAKSVRAHGALIVGTFAEDGPTHCSGLPVTRYAPEELASVFSTSFALVEHEREEHLTPGGILQPVTWVTLRRR